MAHVSEGLISVESAYTFISVLPVLLIGYSGVKDSLRVQPKEPEGIPVKRSKVPMLAPPP